MAYTSSLAVVAFLLSFVCAHSLPESKKTDCHGYLQAISANPSQFAFAKTAHANSISKLRISRQHTVIGSLPLTGSVTAPHIVEALWSGRSKVAPPAAWTSLRSGRAPPAA